MSDLTKEELELNLKHQMATSKAQLELGLAEDRLRDKLLEHAKEVYDLMKKVDQLRDAERQAATEYCAFINPIRERRGLRPVKSPK